MKKIISFASLFLFSVLVAPVARAEVLTVGTCDECYSTIQAAVAAAAYGDGVAIESGY